MRKQAYLDEEDFFSGVSGDDVVIGLAVACGVSGGGGRYKGPRCPHAVSSAASANADAVMRAGLKEIFTVRMAK